MKSKAKRPSHEGLLHQSIQCKMDIPNYLNLELSK